VYHLQQQAPKPKRIVAQQEVYAVQCGILLCNIVLELLSVKFHIEFHIADYMIQFCPEYSVFTDDIYFE